MMIELVAAAFGFALFTAGFFWWFAVVGNLNRPKLMALFTACLGLAMLTGFGGAHLSLAWRILQ